MSKCFFGDALYDIVRAEVEAKQKDCYSRHTEETVQRITEMHLALWAARFAATMRKADKEDAYWEPLRRKAARCKKKEQKP